jgi:C1A family cysteine protease
MTISIPHNRHIAKYGWIPDLPDARDLRYPKHARPAELFQRARLVLPPSLDMRGFVPIIFDQGNLGSCTANAGAGAVLFELKKQGLDRSYIASRLMLYYDERLIEQSTGSDSGAMLRDCMRTLHYRGACDESEWPYDISKFAAAPPQSCYDSGLKHLVDRYLRLDNTNLQAMKECLATGFPFVFGFTVYESFESDIVASTGVVPMPGSSENVLGGHAALCVGFDDPSQRFIVANSWGTGWGQSGFFTIPYAYLTDPNLADDFWTVRLVEG